MSHDLAFWRGADGRDPVAVYRALMDDQRVDGVDAVDSAAVLAACRRYLAGWQQDRNIWVYERDQDGNGPAADLWIGDRIVKFSCYGLAAAQLNQIIDAMNSLGFPLFDPQTSERFVV